MYFRAFLNNKMVSKRRPKYDWNRMFKLIRGKLFQPPKKTPFMVLRNVNNFKVQFYDTGCECDIFGSLVKEITLMYHYKNFVRVWMFFLKIESDI